MPRSSSSILYDDFIDECYRSNPDFRLYKPRDKKQTMFMVLMKKLNGKFKPVCGFFVSYETAWKIVRKAKFDNVVFQEYLGYKLWIKFKGDKAWVEVI